jgi:hypothetical protein
MGGAPKGSGWIQGEPSNSNSVISPSDFIALALRANGATERVAQRGTCRFGSRYGRGGNLRKLGCVSTSVCVSHGNCSSLGRYLCGVAAY